MSNASEGVAEGPTICLVDAKAIQKPLPVFSITFPFLVRSTFMEKYNMGDIIQTCEHSDCLSVFTSGCVVYIKRCSFHSK